MTMLKTITSSDLRAQIKQVLNEVGYGQNQYIVEKFGEPTAAIISMADFRLLQEVRQAQSASALAESRVAYNPYPLRGISHPDIDPSVPALAAEEWDAKQGVTQLIEQARRVNGSIEAGQMGTIGHDELKRMLLEKRA